MTHITRDDVLKLARLSKIKLTEDEVEKFVGELSKIVEYADQIGSVDVRKLLPTDHVTDQVSVMREDKIIDYGVSRDALLKNVPAVENDQIKVKRVIQQ